MKVPDNIKKAIEEYAEANNEANFYERIIYRWLEDMKLTEETASHPMRNMEDCFIDCCKVDYNPGEFIEILENL